MAYPSLTRVDEILTALGLSACEGFVNWIQNICISCTRTKVVFILFISYSLIGWKK